MTEESGNPAFQRGAYSDGIDTVISDPADGDVVTYDAASGKFKNKPQGGTSGQVNWCQINFVTAPTLTAVAPGYTYQAADLSIAKQSGTDFAIAQATISGQPMGVITSAAGGRFQAAAYVGGNQNSSATLDDGSTQQRYKEFLLSMGPSAFDDPTNPSVGVGLLGIDTMVPLLPNGAIEIGSAANTPVSSIGYARPGKICCLGIGVVLVNGFGTDSVPADDIYTLTIWSV